MWMGVLKAWRQALMGGLVLLACGAQAEPLAAGLLVKMKDRAATASASSVVRLTVSAVPAEGAAVQTSRLSALLSRQAIAHQGARPYAFAAHAVRFAHPRTMIEAQADAMKLRQSPDVEWVLVDQILPSAAVARVPALPVQAQDPQFWQQYWLKSRDTTAEQGGLLDVPAAWARLGRRFVQPVTVAVLDTGVPAASEWDHADLLGRLWPGYDFVSSSAIARDGNGLDPDPTDEGTWLSAADKAAQPQLYGSDCAVGDSEWHGLGVTYMLAARTDNDKQGAGLLASLPNEVVLPVRVAGVCGAALSDLVEGMLWSAGIGYQGSPAPNPHPARVINISFGGEGNCDDPQVGSVGWLFRQVVGSLANKGVLVVAAAGNGDANGNGLPSLALPASCHGVMAVTGLDIKGYKAIYSNLIMGGHAGVAVASGNKVWTGGGWQQLSYDDGISTLVNKGKQSPQTGASGYEIHTNLEGTSFAAPQVAGVAALMLSVDPSLTTDELILGLQESVRGFPVVLDSSTGLAYPACDANHTTYCTCTASTCGSGVLDAGRAIDWALAHAAANPNAPDPSDGSFSVGYFTPTRGDQPVAVSRSAMGGGGGAVEPVFLAAAMGWLALVATWRFRSGRR